MGETIERSEIMQTCHWCNAQYPETHPDYKERALADKLGFCSTECKGNHDIVTQLNNQLDSRVHCPDCGAKVRD